MRSANRGVKVSSQPKATAAPQSLGTRARACLGTNSMNTCWQQWSHDTSLPRTTWYIKRPTIERAQAHRCLSACVQVHTQAHQQGGNAAGPQHLPKRVMRHRVERLAQVNERQEQGLPHVVPALRHKLAQCESGISETVAGSRPSLPLEQLCVRVP